MLVRQKKPGTQVFKPPNIKIEVRSFLTSRS